MTAVSQPTPVLLLIETSLHSIIEGYYMAHPTATKLDVIGANLLKRHANWWQRKGCLLSSPESSMLGNLWLPLSNGTIAVEDVDLTPDMVDVDRIVGSALGPGPIETLDDQLRHVGPYTPIPWVEAIMGVPIRTTIQGGSMRARDHVDNWDEWAFHAEHFDSDWYELLMRFVDLLAERKGGKRAITQTLMRGPSDLAEAVLGPENMCLSLYDTPNEMHRFLDFATDLFIKVLHAQLRRIPDIEGGYVNPFGIWAPGTVVRNQCDATAFLSADHYEKWFLPYDMRIWKSVDYSIQHVHSNSLHTVDVLLAQEVPHAIQVTVDIQPAGPQVQEVIPTLKKILSKKSLVIEGWLTQDEVRTLQSELPGDGLSITIRRQPGEGHTGWYMS
jgi:hypothetical protein